MCDSVYVTDTGITRATTNIPTGIVSLSKYVSLQRKEKKDHLLYLNTHVVNVEHV